MDFEAGEEAPYEEKVNSLRGHCGVVSLTFPNDLSEPAIAPRLCVGSHTNPHHFTFQHQKSRKAYTVTKTREYWTKEVPITTSALVHWS